MSEVARYLATWGPAAVTACGAGVFGVIKLKIRTNFHRHVVDKAVEQGQPIDATRIIAITTPGAVPPSDPPNDQDSKLKRGNHDTEQPPAPD